MSLKGKVGVVTSSTSGIGLGIARAFAPVRAQTFSSMDSVSGT